MTAAQKNTLLTNRLFLPMSCEKTPGFTNEAAKEWTEMSMTEAEEE